MLQLLHVSGFGGRAVALLGSWGGHKLSAWLFLLCVGGEGARDEQRTHNSHDGSDVTCVPLSSVMCAAR